MRLARPTALLLATAAFGTFASAQSAPPPPKPIDASARVKQLVSEMTPDEKFQILGGCNVFATCEIRRLHIPRFQMTDGPVGAHIPPPSTAYAAGIGLAASWDTNLAYETGVQLGRDARSRGAAYLLGPGVNIYRAPMNGRNFEYFGEDPLLAGRIATGYIQGVQSQHVSATIKHYMGNNSEYARTTENSEIGERAMREIYLPVFEDGAKLAHVGSFMDSYNKVNGTYATANREINTVILKNEWGWGGVLMSDWGASHDAIADANSGLDLEMPFGSHFNKEKLGPAVASGQVLQSQIDDKVTRILALAERMGWLDAPVMDTSIPRFNLAGDAVARKGALESIVLLKNAGNMLPLDKSKLKTIAVIGPDAWPAIPTAGGSGQVPTFTESSLLTGIAREAGAGISVTYDRGVPSADRVSQDTRWRTAASGGQAGVLLEEFPNTQFNGRPLSSKVEKKMRRGEASVTDIESFNSMLQMSRKDFENAETNPANGARKTTYKRWTGYYNVAEAGEYDLQVEDGIQFRLLVDDKVAIDNSVIPYATLSWKSMQFAAGMHKVVLEEWAEPGYGSSSLRAGIVRADAWVSQEAKTLAQNADVVVLALGYNTVEETEGADRPFELPIGQQRLIRTIAAANHNVIVTGTSGGSFEAASWVDSVPVLLANWYPGQEGGEAFARVLFGLDGPTGRLPISWEKKITDNPSYAYYYPAPGSETIQYRDGVFVGYRGYQHNHVAPLFPFGFGLGYSTFAYSNFALERGGMDQAIYTVSFDVKNTGPRADSDVAQVYVAPPAGKVERPEEELKSFLRVTLAPGETRHVSLPLNTRAFTYFDVDAKEWTAPAGAYEVRVGRSSEDIVLRGNATLERALHADITTSVP